MWRRRRREVETEWQAIFIVRPIITRKNDREGAARIEVYMRGKRMA